MNKFDLINKVLVSALKNKEVLIELIMRADEDGFSYVGVERLSQVRGIKHTKNYPWQELHAMSDVLTVKLGRDLTKDEVEDIEAKDVAVYGDKNYFWVREAAILALPAFEVTKSKKPKSSERVKNPALAEPSTLHLQTKDPAVEGYLDPALEGCNSTTDISNKNSREEFKTKAVADAPALTLSNKEMDEDMKIIEETRSQMFKDGTLPLLSNLVDAKVTYSLPGKEVDGVDDSLASSNEEWVTAPRTPKKAKKQTPASVKKQAAGSSTRDRSVALLKKKLEEAASKKDKAVEHLENRIVAEGLSETQAEQARAMYYNRDWRADIADIQRATLAPMKAANMTEEAR